MKRAARSILPPPVVRPNKEREAVRAESPACDPREPLTPGSPAASRARVPGTLGVHRRAGRVRNAHPAECAKSAWRVRDARARLVRAVRSGCAGASEAAARLFRFGLVGASGFAVDVACYLALQWIGLDHRVARFISFFPAASWNWLLNRRVTFGERAPDARAHQWARFVTSSVAGAGVNAGSYAVLTSLTGFFDHHRMLALLLGIGLGGLVNFALATRYVYRRRGVDTRTGPDRPPPGNRGGAAERREDERERTPTWASKPAPLPAR